MWKEFVKGEITFYKPLSKRTTGILRRSQWPNKVRRYACTHAHTQTHSHTHTQHIALCIFTPEPYQLLRHGGQLISLELTSLRAINQYLNKNTYSVGTTILGIKSPLLPHKTNYCLGIYIYINTSNSNANDFNYIESNGLLT